MRDSDRIGASLPEYPSSSVHRLFPFVAWFPITRLTLRADFIAGVTVALVLVPQSMAYAQLAGMPPYYGLYASMLPVAIGALWGSSRQLATGPVAMVSLLTGASLSQFAGSGGEAFIAYAIALSFMVGLFQLTLGLFRLGAIVNFVSHPVIVGFTNAAVIIIALSQLDKLLGVKADRSDRFLADILQVVRQGADAHLPTVAIGVVALVLMIAGRRRMPAVPWVLVAAAVGTLVSWAGGFERAGGAVVGEIPRGLPPLGIPQASMGTIATLATTAMVITLVGFMEAVSIARSMATRTRQKLDANQELIGQGLANLASSASSSFPVSGSFSRSAVNFSAGALTGLSSVFTALLVLVTLLLLTPLLYHLPQAVLAAIIVQAVVGLVNLPALLHAWQAHRHDGAAAAVAFVATLAFAPNLEFGVLFGGGLAVVLYLYRTMRPRVAMLVRHDDGRLREAEGADTGGDKSVVFQFEGDLYFANVPYFEDSILAAVAAKPQATHLLVVGDGISEIDASGEEVMRHLVERLRAGGVQVVFCGLRQQVLRVMRNTGLDELIGAANMFYNADLALDAILAGRCELPPVPEPTRA